MFSRMKSDSKPLALPPAHTRIACIRSCLFILAGAAFCLSCLFCLSSLLLLPAALALFLPLSLFLLLSLFSFRKLVTRASVLSALAVWLA